MSTRATYQFKQKDLPTLTFYIHHDGYPEGAAHYFWKMHHCTRQGVSHAEQFLVANDNAGLTRGHEYHGDTDYRYTMDGDFLVAARRLDRGEWSNFFVGDWWEFVNKYGEEFCENFEPLKCINEQTIYANGAKVVYTRSQLRAAIDRQAARLESYRQAHPTMSGNIAGLKYDLTRAEEKLARYDGVDNINAE